MNRLDGSLVRHALVAAWLCSGALAQDASTNIDWQADLDQARAMAAAQDKPLLLVFRCER